MATDHWSYGPLLALLRIVCRGYFRTRVTGRENLPPRGVATIVVTNHTSALDVPVIGHALNRPGHFLAKVELTRVPLFGRYVVAMGGIPTQRDGQDTAALRATLAVLESGGLVGLAPEGTRSPDGSLGQYDPGFVWLASRTGALVVPCAVYGARQLMPRGARLPRPGPIWVRFGAAMDVNAQLEQVTGAVGGVETKRARMEAVANAVRERTLAMLAELETEAAASSARRSAGRNGAGG